MTEPARYGCTLTPEDAPDRAAQVQRLRAGLQTRERHGQQLRLRFDPGLAEVVEAFVHDESQCCGFYRFTIEQSTETVELSVWAPADAEPLLHGLYAVFEPDQAVSVPQHHAMNKQQGRDRQDAGDA